MLKKYLILVFSLFSLAFFAHQSFALDCTNCAVGACYCNVTECSAGTLNVYSAACAGIPSKEFIFSNSTFVWTGSKAQNYYFQVYCDSGIKSSCTKVNLTYAGVATTTTTTSTVSTTTTTTFSKTECPYECCVGEFNYYNKYCDDGDCVDNQCIVSTSTTSEPPLGGAGFEINYSLVGAVAILVLVAVFLFYFFRGRKSKPNDRWSELYKKYGRR